MVEDDDSVRTVCAGIAESLGCRVHTASSVPDALHLIGGSAFDVAFLDLRLPGGNGTMLLEALRTAQPRTFIVVMTAFATVSSAVDLMKSGAGDLLHKPFALYTVTAVLETAAARQQRTQSSRALEDRLQAGIAAGRLVGHSLPMQKLLRIVAKVATTRHPVLLTGERGTGKEVVARAIHANGPNAASPFVPVDCDCLEPPRLEAELFGSEATTASPAREGVLAAAGDGTVYLGEVAALPLATQARLLRTLESRQIRTALGAASAPFSARVLASSCTDLETDVQQGRFRKDLFYRLNVVNLRVPPLRERLDDLAALTEYFLEAHRQEYGIHFNFSTNGWDSMAHYAWPGNIAELESLVAYACATANDPILHFEDLSTEVKSFVPPSMAVAEPVAPPVSAMTLQELEQRAITDTLKRLNGDKLQAARVLGIGKTTLYRKLKEYGLADEIH